MAVTLKYFAWVRERIGASEEQTELPANVTTVAEAIDWLAKRGPGYAHAFERRDLIRAAVDQVHAGPGAALKGAREIAFFPPITGG
jgi:molybdopterin synthase sulfur carrier subunit